MSGDVTKLLRDRRLNALLAWLVVGLFLTLGVGSVLDGQALWTVFAATLVFLAVLPPLAFRNVEAMLPWEMLLLAALPVAGRLFATIPATGTLSTYLSVAAVALIVAVELHLFTPVKMTPRFAVVFVSVTTLATAGVWAVVRWVSDLLLGTAFLLDPALSKHAIEEALMLEFVASTIAGVGAGLFFAVYMQSQLATATFPEEATP